LCGRFQGGASHLDGAGKRLGADGDASKASWAVRVCGCGDCSGLRGGEILRAAVQAQGQSGAGAIPAQVRCVAAIA